MRNLLPDLKGLAILDNDGQNRQDQDFGALRIRYWRRYEAENYFVTPDVLRRYAESQYPADDLFSVQTHAAIREALTEVVTELVFDGSADDYRLWSESPPDANRLVWEAKTERRKLSMLAEEFFRRLALKLGGSMLLKKGELHRLAGHAPLTAAAETEVRTKLDQLMELFKAAYGHEEAAAEPAVERGSNTAEATRS